jgi:predicted alpha/beta superfamily hydrolase
MISKETAEHYVWAEVYDGWDLTKRAELSVIHEYMPAGAAEVRLFTRRRGSSSSCYRARRGLKLRASAEFGSFSSSLTFVHGLKNMLEISRLLAFCFALQSLIFAHGQTLPSSDDKAVPLVIGETFTIDSKILGETRRINVYVPPDYTKSADARLPVLYMPDGGINEDFLHVAGLVQVSVGNQTMRPFLLVGIENTERRRDMTGATENEEDKKIAPHVGGSQAFRRFIRDELMPQVKRRYRTTDETAIVGESLAGLFVVETFLLEPDLFDTYIAFDPSLWWNNQKLVSIAAARLRANPKLNKTLYFASSGDRGVAEITQPLADVLSKSAPAGVKWHYEKMPDEKHSTIYHPAALRAFRTVFKPNVNGRM